MGWIGVDLDHTLAEYESGSAGTGVIGRPIRKMVRRVKAWRKQGREVRIMTARVNKIPGWDHEWQRKIIEEWCFHHIGEVLQVTNEKDFEMIELWDDRAVRVEAGTGRKLSPSLHLRSAKKYLHKNR